MNRFKTDISGGLPLVNDDFRWFDSAYREGMKGIIKGLIGTKIDYCILEGCQVTQDPGDEELLLISEGFVYMNSEIFYVPAHSVAKAGAGQTAYFAVEVSWDASGLKTFEDTTTHDTYEIRRAKIVNSNNPPVGYMPASASTLIIILAERLGLNQTWTQLKLTESNVHINAGGISNVSGWLKYSQNGRTLHAAVDLYLDVNPSDLALVGNMIYIDLPQHLAPQTTILHTNLILNAGRTQGGLFKLFTWVGPRLYIAYVTQEPLIAGSYYWRGVLTYEMQGTGSYNPEPSAPAIPTGGAGGGNLTLLYQGNALGTEGEQFALSGVPQGDVIVTVQGSTIPESKYAVTDDVLAFTYQLGENDYVMIWGMLI